MEAHSWEGRVLMPPMTLPDGPRALLTGRSRLVRNSMLNLIGQGIPFLAAFFAIPLLIRGLGTDRFGVLTLAWMVIGYFSLFDLGLGRALTQVVAEKVSQGDHAQAPPIVWTALATMFALGIVGALAVSLISPWLVHSVLKIPGALQRETLHSFYVLAAAIPIVVVTAGMIGILSAFQRFGVLNAIRAPMGIYSFVAPLAILHFSQSLQLVTAVLVVGRLLACGAYLVACLPVMPDLRSVLVRQYTAIRPLFTFGAWMTVTNVIGPFLMYLDRFVIGAIVSVAAVAYYATPYEMVTKLLIVPAAILGVLFPAFAASYRQDHDRMVRLFARGTKYIALILFPIILVITAFAHEGLEWWLGDEFARHSAPALQCLAIGVFINSLAQLFATLVQGVGRPDLSAKLHLLELPIYLPLLWLAIRNNGVIGAALAWSGRVAVDGILLFWLSGRLLHNRELLKRLAAGLLAALGGLALPLWVAPLAPRAATVVLVMVAFVATAWFVVLAEDERASIKGRIGWVRARLWSEPVS
jgi:O-antigen/teichoic acid export membrane protein